MWRSIIEELEGIDCLGPALPVACHRHPSVVEYVSKPGILPQIAPDGMPPTSLQKFESCSVLQADV